CCRACSWYARVARSAAGGRTSSGMQNRRARRKAWPQLTRLLQTEIGIATSHATRTGNIHHRKLGLSQYTSASQPRPSSDCEAWARNASLQAVASLSREGDTHLAWPPAKVATMKRV